MGIIQQLLKRNLSLVFILLLFLNYDTSYAQNRAFKFDHLTIADGLSQSTVFCILEDSKGFMWFGTRTGGLNKYDGYTFTNYRHNPKNGYSISGNQIISLYEDKHGFIWVGTRKDGLNRFDSKLERFYSYKHNPNKLNSLINDTINDFIEDSTGQLLIATNNGLCTYDEQNDNFIFQPSIEDINIRRFAKANNGFIWIATTEGLFLYNPYKHKVEKHYTHDANNPNSLSSNYLTSILHDSKGRLWLGTRYDGLNLMPNTKSPNFKRFRHDADKDYTLRENFIRVIAEGSNGSIWLGTKLALEQLLPEQQDKTDPKFIHHIKIQDDDNSLSQNSVYSILQDSKGDFWIGTWSGGVNYLNINSVNFQHFKHQTDNENSLSNNLVSSFAENEEGVWIGTEGRGLNFYNKKQKTFTHYVHQSSNPYSLRHNQIRSLFIDSNKNLWVGTQDGLQVFNSTTHRFKSYLEGFAVYDILEDYDGSLWIGTSKCLCHFNPEKEEFIYYFPEPGNKNSLSSKYITTLYLDKNNNLWIGTRIGLNYFNREQKNFTNYFYLAGDTNSLSNDYISSIIEDRNGYLWFGTLDGLNRFNPKTKYFERIDEKNGIPAGVVYNLIMDEEGLFWFSTNKGLTRFNPHLSLEISNNVIRHYDVEDGLQANEFIINSSFKSKNGELYYGGINGYNVFNPTSIVENKNIPEIAFTSFKLSNKEVKIAIDDSPLKKHISYTREIKLNHNQSVFTIGFVALNYYSPQKNQYAYKMEGFDKEWNYVGNKREATYTNLPPGKYTFKVMASNNDGVWNKTGNSLDIIIIPAWWQTWLFKIGLILFLLIIALGVYFYRVLALEKQKQLLEDMVLERTSELKNANANLEERQEEIVMQKEFIVNKNVELELQKEKIEKAYNNVETLSKLGNQITMSLTLESILDSAYKSLKSIMNVPFFSIGLYDIEKSSLVFKGSKYLDTTLPEYSFNLNDTTRVAVWCFDSQQQVLIKDFSQEYNDYVSEKGESVTGILPESIMYIPLNVKDKRIGVISVQSAEKDQYSKYHQDILQNIGTYIAIALDNAEAYEKIELQAKSLSNYTKKLREKQHEIQLQNHELTVSEEELSQLNEELSEINVQLTNQKKELEDTISELKNTQIQLVHSEKMASVGLLTAGIAHEINNPLNFIKGGETALREYAKTELKEYVTELEPLFEIIEEGIKRAINIVGSLNRFNRKTENYTEDCDIHLIINNCLTIMENQLKHKVELKKNFTKNPCIVIGNEGELHQLVINLLNNAEQAISDKGEISITTYVKNNNLFVEFLDNGVGIDESIMHKVTRPFFTTKESGKGTGLGLSISSSIIKKHNGEIIIESLKEGAKVIVSLPIKA